MSSVGDIDGTALGDIVGTHIGCVEGVVEGGVDGHALGDIVGTHVGCVEGDIDGIVVLGYRDGTLLGAGIENGNFYAKAIIILFIE